jgi:hypothetical protein
LSRLDETLAAYFDEERVDGRTDAVFHQAVVTKWPDSLLLQLERWEFSVNTGERVKLVH